MTGNMRSSRNGRWGLLAMTGCLLVASGCSLFAPRSPRTGETNVKPGINDKFKAEDFEADDWIPRFESESREIFTQRQKIADTVGAKPGMTVADIGAGTGFMTLLFAEQVGKQGKVYAVELAADFLKRINRLAANEGLGQIETVLCTEDSVELPPNSIDLAFICDTYHHFEYPMSTMATLHSALKPGGELVVVDFIRIEDTSRDWVLGHVRAGQDVTIEEIQAAGFELLDRGKDIDFLSENYLMRFGKVD